MHVWHALQQQVWRHLTSSRKHHVTFPYRPRPCADHDTFCLKRCDIYPTWRHSRQKMHRTESEKANWGFIFMLFVGYQVTFKPDPQNPSIQSCPSKQQLSLLSNRWAVKPDHWTNGLCCPVLSFLQMSLFPSMSGQTISGFSEQLRKRSARWCHWHAYILWSGEKYLPCTLHSQVSSDKTRRRNWVKLKLSNFVYVAALSRGRIYDNDVWTTETVYIWIDVKSCVESLFVSSVYLNIYGL